MADLITTIREFVITNQSVSSKISEKKSLSKNFGKAAIVAGIGLALLIPGTSLAKFSQLEMVPAEKLTTGSFAMKPSSLNLQSAVWKLDGVPIPENQLNNIVIAPGQTLVMEAVTKASVREGATGTLGVTGFPELLTAIRQDPAFFINVQYNGENAFNGTGTTVTGESFQYIDRNVGENVLDTASTTKIIITMFPLTSAVYDDLSVGREKSFDLSKIGMYLEHNGY